jgi:class 3 adenylate cyclase
VTDETVNFQGPGSDNGHTEETDEEISEHVAMRKRIHEEIRSAVREYLDGSDQRGEKLTRMLSISRGLSERQQAASASTEQTILFSDFAGSCSLFHDLGDVAAHELIQEYFSISQISIAKFSGEIIKYTGDGILALFPNTSRALKASLFAQSMFEIHNKKFPILPINVRMGVNVGEVIQDEIDAYGTSINLSARLCDASQPGHILCSNIVRLRNQGQGFEFELHNDIFAKGFPVPIKTHFLQERRADIRIEKSSGRIC